MLLAHHRAAMKLLRWFSCLVFVSACEGGDDPGGPGGSDSGAPLPGVMLLPATPRVTSAQVPTLTPQSGVRAFPGADGFGAEATGGRGGRVIYVTTLAAEGPGSLSAALAADGPRYILFKVSGVIESSPYIAKGNVTLAGQTSPGGIVVRGIHTDEANFCDSNCGAGVRGVDNIIVRHLRTRPGDPGSNGLIDGDGLRLRHSRNVVIDHVSVGNAVDEGIEISYSNHITVQDSILAETIGDHAERGGMLVNYSNPAAGYELNALSFVRTAWVRILGRYPELSRESVAAAGSTMDIELSNNLLWDQRYYVDTAHLAGTPARPMGNALYRMNWVGNLGVARPTYRYAMLFFPNPSMMSRVFFDDDHLTSRADRTNWELVYCCDDFLDAPTPMRPSWAEASRLPLPAMNYIPSANLRPYILAHAGAFPRDAMDRRLMGYVADGIAPPGAVNVNPANDAYRLDWGAPSAAPMPPVDTDNDGMPDAWERAHMLDPAVDDHNGLTVGRAMGAPVEGYPNLEVYLWELAEQRLREGSWGR
jgi:pectate lyase